MGEKPALFDPITERDMYTATAYLIAITPDLQRSTKTKVAQQIAKQNTISRATAMIAAPGVVAPAGDVAPTVDLVKAKKTYEDVCSQCHELSEIVKAPPKTTAESRAMIQRMIKDNDAELKPDQIELVAAWLDAEYVEKRK